MIWHSLLFSCSLQRSSSLHDKGWVLNLTIEANSDPFWPFSTRSNLPRVILSPLGRWGLIRCSRYAATNPNPSSIVKIADLCPDLSGKKFYDPGQCFIHRELSYRKGEFICHFCSFQSLIETVLEPKLTHQKKRNRVKIVSLHYIDQWARVYYKLFASCHGRLAGCQGYWFKCQISRNQSQVNLLNLKLTMI